MKKYGNIYIIVKIPHLSCNFLSFSGSAFIFMSSFSSVKPETAILVALSFWKSDTMKKVKGVLSWRDPGTCKWPCKFLLDGEELEGSTEGKLL